MIIDIISEGEQGKINLKGLTIIQVDAVAIEHSLVHGDVNAIEYDCLQCREIRGKKEKLLREMIVLR